MSLTNGPNLGVLVNGAQGEQHFTELMKRWRALDALIQANVKSATTTAEPGSPSDGDTYILPASPTGTHWSGNGKKIVRYSSVASAWEFFTPKEGWLVYVQDADVYGTYDGSAWGALSTGGGATGPSQGGWVVKSATTLATPGSPTTGDTYLVPPSGMSGAWSGHPDAIATWDGAAWQYVANGSAIYGKTVFALDTETLWFNHTGNWYAIYGFTNIFFRVLQKLVLSTAAQLLATSVSLTNYAAGNTATLGNAPVSGNPAKWIKIDDNGTDRYIPTW